MQAKTKLISLHSSSLLCAGVLLLSSCADTFVAGSSLNTDNQAAPNKWLDSANWNTQEKLLVASGSSPVNGIFVEITDSTTGKRLGLAPVKNNRWVFTSETLNTSPCQINARIQVSSETLEVSGNNCIQGPGVKTRTLVPLANSITTNAVAPRGRIIQPAADMTVQVGTAITLAAGGTDPGGSEPLSYLWQFNGVRPNLLVQNPGPIVFNRPGVHKISLTVINSLGVPDPTPSTRTIQVLPAEAILNTAPEAFIDSPAGDISINIGDTVNFTGSAIHPGPVTDLSFLWMFGGAAPNSSVQNPGNVTFNKAGVFNISLTVIDAGGLANQNLAQVTITVNDTGGNQAPTGMILSPTGDMTINPDSSVFFQATATDPNNDTPISYLWNFDGAAPNSSVQNPGDILFRNPGIYSVSMIAIDSTGLADPNPPVRTITVDGSSVVNQDLPETSILMPSADMTIDANPAGDTLVSFNGEAISPVGNDPVMLMWTVDDVALAETTPQVDIAFPGPGTYVVALHATDSLGQMDPTPAERIITIVDAVATAPDSEIEMPKAKEVTIAAGESVDFAGEAESATSLTPLSYLWTFDGAAPDSTEAMPGPVVFDIPGTYIVNFTVIAADGTADPSPDMRTIIVEEMSAPPSPAEPNGMIVSPETDMEIMAGEAVDFNGMASSEDPAAVFIYDWDLGVATSTEAMPGLVTYPTPGIYEVSFTVTDANSGVSDPTPDSRIITVLDPAAPPAPATDPLTLRPTATILTPDMDVTIQVGDSVEFLGEGADPAGGELIYEWSFGGAAPEANVQNPGVMTFNQVGVFKVKLEVFSTATGLHADPDPMVTITVEPAPPAPATLAP